MEIHPPEGPVHSWKDFLVHIAIVTLGILIALGLEGVVEWSHHRSLAREAKEGIETEIKDNREQLKGNLEGLAMHEKQLDAVEAYVRKVEENRNVPKTDERFGWTTTPMFSTSWNTAVATGALSYVKYDDVKKYTVVYDMQRDFQTASDRGLQSAVALISLTDMTIGRDPKRVTDAQLLELERMVGQARANIMVVKTFGATLEKVMDSAEKK